MSLEPKLTETDYELLSAYIDDMLVDAERATLEARLVAEPALRAELAALRQLVKWVQQLPPLPAPRNFTLTPALVGAPLQMKPRPRPSIWLSLAGYASAAAALLLVISGMLLIFSGDEEVALSPAFDRAQVGAYASPTPTAITIPMTPTVVEPSLFAESPSATATSVIIPTVETSRAGATGASEAAGYAQRSDANSAALSAPPGQTEAFMLGSAPAASGETGIPAGIGGGMGETAEGVAAPFMLQTAPTVFVETIPLPQAIQTAEIQDENGIARESASSGTAMATSIALPTASVSPAPISSEVMPTTPPAESPIPSIKTSPPGNDIWPGALFIGSGGILFMITVIWLVKQRRRD